MNVFRLLEDEQQTAKCEDGARQGVLERLEIQYGMVSCRDMILQWKLGSESSRHWHELAVEVCNREVDQEEGLGL